MDIKDKLKRFKWIIAGTVLAGSVALGAPLIIPANEFPATGWIRPTTDEQWKENVKRESLNIRFDYQLNEMKANLSEKIIKHKQDLDELVDCPECFKYPLAKSDPLLTSQEIETRYQESLTQAREEYERVKISLERIDAEIRLRFEKKVDRKQDILKLKPSTKEEMEELKKL